MRGNITTKIEKGGRKEKRSRAGFNCLRRDG